MIRLPILVVAVTAAAAAQRPPEPTPAEALKLAFPDCTVERTTVLLDESQREQVRELCGEELAKGMAFPYVARDEKGALVGIAYFDTHRVRTLRQTLMVVVDPAGRVARVEVLAFGEPPEYRPRAKWYTQFERLPLDDELRLRRKIRGVTGATLTARATTDCVRRVLALHAVAGPPAPGPNPAPKPTPPPRPVGGGTRGGT